MQKDRKKSSVSYTRHRAQHIVHLLSIYLETVHLFLLCVPRNIVASFANLALGSLIYLFQP